jgi:hypothetical protein
MRIIGCDLHARQQTIAMLDSDTEKTLEHQGETVREFYYEFLKLFSKRWAGFYSMSQTKAHHLQAQK